MQAIVTALTTGRNEAEARFTKRIGTTIYEVNIGFSKNAKETMDEIIFRLIKNEAEGGKVA